MFTKFRFWKEESGQIMIMFAAAVVVIFGFAALAVDIGNVAYNKSQLQTAADAAALAGAQDLPIASTAINTAVDFAGKNGLKATQNGVKKDGDTVTATTPYNGESTKILVECTRTVQYSFARFLGFTQSDVTVRAVAKKTGGALSNSTFGYAVFAGDAQLKWNGGNFVIGGDIYGDKGIKLTGIGSAIDGHVVYNTGTVSVGGTYLGVPTNKKEIMPDFSQLVKDQATENGNHFANQAAFKAIYYDQPGIPAVPATPAVYDKKGKLVTPANPGSPAIPAQTGAEIDGPIWVDGDLDIDQPIHGKGIIYADGDYEYSYNTAETNSMASICFYSDGNITFNGGSGRISGILYAPNGNITINGTPHENKIWGRMIAKDVTVNGNGYTVISRGSDLDWLDTFTVHPTFKLVE